MADPRRSDSKVDRLEVPSLREAKRKGHRQITGSTTSPPLLRQCSTHAALLLQYLEVEVVFR